jgi:hypothetical protein
VWGLPTPIHVHIKEAAAYLVFTTYSLSPPLISLDNIYYINYIYNFSFYLNKFDFFSMSPCVVFLIWIICARQIPAVWWWWKDAGIVYDRLPPPPLFFSFLNGICYSVVHQWMRNICPFFHIIWKSSSPFSAATAFFIQFFVLRTFVGREMRQGGIIWWWSVAHLLNTCHDDGEKKCNGRRLRNVTKCHQMDGYCTLTWLPLSLSPFL